MCTFTNFVQKRFLKPHCLRCVCPIGIEGYKRDYFVSSVNDDYCIRVLWWNVPGICSKANKYKEITA